jgi:hypothetical protein
MVSQTSTDENSLNSTSSIVHYKTLSLSQNSNPQSGHTYTTTIINFIRFVHTILSTSYYSLINFKLITYFIIFTQEPNMNYTVSFKFTQARALEFWSFNKVLKKKKKTSRTKTGLVPTTHLPTHPLGFIGWVGR